MQTRASLCDLEAASKHFAASSGLLPVLPRRCALPDLEIKVWRARLDLDAWQVMRCSELLSRDEQSRVARLQFERDRRRFILARGMLRVLLSSHLDVSPSSITFGYTKRGKPFVVEPRAQIQFNVSHSGERALYAISNSCRLGVDLERLDRNIDCTGLARRFFTPREFAALIRLPESCRQRAFFACWTRKEAIVKAIGDGLALPLDQFEVTVAPDAAPRVLDFTALTHHAADWTLYSANVDRDYIATVAKYRNR